MRILEAQDIAAWDKFTMEHEPILPIDLMERAASRLTQRMQQELRVRNAGILIGPGNNGGDGLVMARLLSQRDVKVTVYLLAPSEKCSEDNRNNLDRLPKEVRILDLSTDILPLSNSEHDVWVDALFGYGLVRPLEGRYGQVLGVVNGKTGIKIAVDIPSGLYCDDNRKNPLQHVFLADRTYTFQVPKLSFLHAEYARWVGEFTVVDIGLHPDFILQSEANIRLVEEAEAGAIVRPLSQHVHKFDLGYAGIVGGAENTLGAPLLSALGALRTGAGLVSLAAPRSIGPALRTWAPEVMSMPTDGEEELESVELADMLTALGVGPGLGMGQGAQGVLDRLLEMDLPLVLDADALNIIAARRWQKRIPKDSIITPHVGELARLFGQQESPEDRLDVAAEYANAQGVVILLKGRYSVTIAPDGERCFNSTGNPGMATAGSGDVLLGVVTALRSQAYSPRDAAVLGAYLHGLAGDIAAEKGSPRAMIARDIIHHLSDAWSELESSTSS